MVGRTSNGPARDRVLKLMEERDAIDREIREQNAILEAEGQVGMHGPLVDDEGYPRSDIDVYKVRHARHRIICLQNDYKTLMKRIEQGLALVHSQFLNEGQSSSAAQHAATNGHANGHSNAMNGHATGMNGHATGMNGHATGMNGHATGMNGDTNTMNGHADGHSNGYLASDESGADDNRDDSRRVFARIARVEVGSPAEIDGLRCEDEVLQFGSINSSNFREINQMNEIVRHSINQPIRVEVRRNTRNILTLSLTPRRWAQPGYLGCQIHALL